MGCLSLILVGVLFMFVMVVVIAAANRLNVIDFDSCIHAESIDEILRRIEMMEKNRAITSSAYIDGINKLNKDIHGLLVGGMGAELERAQLRDAVNRLTNYSQSLQDLTNVTFLCGHRTGHKKFECVDVTMGEKEPVFTFVCKECSLAYQIPDSQLHKKEARLAVKYVGTFLPSGN